MMSFLYQRAFVRKLTQQTGPEYEVTQLASDYSWCHSQMEIYTNKKNKKNKLFSFTDRQTERVNDFE